MNWSDIEIRTTGSTEGPRTGDAAKQWLIRAYPGLVDTSSPTQVVINHQGSDGTITQLYRDAQLIAYLGQLLGNRFRCHCQVESRGVENYRRSMVRRGKENTLAQVSPVLEMYLDVDRDGRIDAEPANHTTWTGGIGGRGARVVADRRTPMRFEWRSDKATGWTASLRIAPDACCRIFFGEGEDAEHVAGCMPGGDRLLLHEHPRLSQAIADRNALTLWIEAALPSTSPPTEVTLRYEYAWKKSAGVKQTAVVRIEPWLGDLYELKLFAISPVAPAIAARAAQVTLQVQEPDRLRTAYQEEEFLPTDVGYRISIADPFTLNDENLLGDAGHATSRPDDYAARDDLAEVSPVIQLEVRVVCKQGGVPKPVPDGLTVGWEINDPPETFDEVRGASSPTQPVRWLRQLARTMGGRNCPHRFGGARRDDGIHALEVLRQLDGDRWEPLEAFRGRRGLSRVRRRDSDGADVAIVAFCPPPISGDAYQFTLRLHDNNDNQLELAHASRPDVVAIEQVSAPFTVWRETDVALKICLPGVEDEFLWDEVEAAYRAAFLEIAHHAGSIEINPTSFEDEVRRELPPYSGSNVVHNEEMLLPNYVRDRYSEGEIRHGVKQIIYRIVSRLARLRGGIVDPNDDNGDGGRGLYMVLCKNLFEGSTLAGLYACLGQFYMVQHGDFTLTFVHEMGHALYLRHCLSEQVKRRKPRLGWTGEPVEHCWVVVPDNPFDHDPEDAVACVMSYSNSYYGDDGKTVAEHPVSWHFCAVCLLRLRFWDGVKLARDPAFRRLILDRLVPRGEDIAIVEDCQLARCYNHDCDDCHSLVEHDTLQGPVDDRRFFRALVLPDRTRNEFNHEVWQDLGRIEDTCWKSSDDAVAEFHNNELTLKKEGTAKIHFEFDGKSSRKINIVVEAKQPGTMYQHGRRLRCKPEHGPWHEAKQFDFIDSTGTDCSARVNGHGFYVIKRTGDRADRVEQLRILGWNDETWIVDFDEEHRLHQVCENGDDGERAPLTGELHYRGWDRRKWRAELA